MANVMQSIDVHVPVQWTQFASFPQFMAGITDVRQRHDTHLHWIAEINGQSEEWDAEITAQSPDQRVAWKSTTGRPNAGVVTFHRLDANETRITAQMDWQPEGVTEKAGAALGFDAGQIKGDLERFKAFIEAQGVVTGAWRGTVEQGAAS